VWGQSSFEPVRHQRTMESAPSGPSALMLVAVACNRVRLWCFADLWTDRSLQAMQGPACPRSCRRIRRSPHLEHISISRHVMWEPWLLRRAGASWMSIPGTAGPFARQCGTVVIRCSVDPTTIASRSSRNGRELSTAAASHYRRVFGQGAFASPKIESAVVRFKRHCLTRGGLGLIWKIDDNSQGF